MATNADKNSDGIINRSDQLSYPVALAGAATCSTAAVMIGDYQPSKNCIRYLFVQAETQAVIRTYNHGLIPFIDTTYFKFGYGDVSAGERIIVGNCVHDIRLS